MSAYHRVQVIVAEQVIYKANRKKTVYYLLLSSSRIKLAIDFGINLSMELESRF
jgi:hypothetical protein